MDSGRLPAYRSSYLLRFHPYPRMKVPVRERVLISWEPAQHEPHQEPSQVDILKPECGTLPALNETIRESGDRNETQLRQRRSSLSALIVDLVLAFKKLSLRKN